MKRTGRRCRLAAEQRPRMHIYQSTLRINLPSFSLEGKDTQRFHHHVVTLGMLWHAGIDKRARESDISRAVHNVVGNNGSDRFSIDLEDHFHGRPEYAIVVEP